MSLTKHQEEKLQESLSILRQSKRLLISGSAGVGKTFMVNTLVKELSKRILPFERILCSAPTNKAVSVVKDKVDPLPNLEFTTVHAALKIKQEINLKTGEISFNPSFTKNPPLTRVKLFIIDEASMLNTELLQYVEEHADLSDCTVIFIGDHKQLNPVKEDVSPVFTAHYPEVELTEIVRQGEGNPIINLSRNLSIITQKEDSRIKDKGYIHSSNLSQVIETLAVVNGSDDLKYLAWTNKEVHNINTLVRQRIYGDNPRKVELGEVLVFNKPYKEEFYTNQEVKVNKLSIVENKFSYISGYKKDGPFTVPEFTDVKFKCYSVNPVYKTDTGNESSIIILHEDAEKQYKTTLEKLKSMCLSRRLSWTDFYGFVNNFADITYNHAITVHKSQGSTYKQAIVNVKNINLNRNDLEKEKLLYTAVTRASNLLILYKT